MTSPARSSSAPGPAAVGAFVRVDALVELGRYDAAERELQAMIDRKPNLAAYARVSYLRELNGDLEGAASAMRLAVAAGGPAPENNAYVLALLGELERRLGREAAARRAFGMALALVPRFAAAEAGLARLESRRAGASLAAPMRRLRGVVDTLPLPEYVVALGETSSPPGDTPRRARGPRAGRGRAAAAARRRRRRRRRARGLRGRPRLAGEGGRRSPGAAGTRRRACARPTRSAGR